MLIYTIFANFLRWSVGFYLMQNENAKAKTDKTNQNTKVHNEVNFKGSEINYNRKFSAEYLDENSIHSTKLSCTPTNKSDKEDSISIDHEDNKSKEKQQFIGNLIKN